MNLYAFIRKAVKAIIPYGIIVLRRRQWWKANKIAANVQAQRGRNEDYADAVFKETFLKTVKGKRVFDFNGMLLPDVSQNTSLLHGVRAVFGDTFYFPVLFNDRYDKFTVRIADLYGDEGPYGYTDSDFAEGKVFDVTVKPGDVVIDAGAWIGDFSAYAASKGAEVYAFEPVTETFHLLEETASLNKPAVIHPVKKGLGGGYNFNTYLYRF